MTTPTEPSQDLKIRKAVRTDAEEICEIYNEALVEGRATFETEPRTESQCCKWITEHDERHPILVAVRNSKVDETWHNKEDNVQGWASITPYSSRLCYSGVGEFSIYVKHGFRGKGVGKKLMTELIQEAGRLGYWKLISRILPFNVASRNLCKSCGFREVGFYEKHGKLNGKWLDVVIVEKLIHENLR
jgi:phosphinothricin acetyltransferase